MRMSGNVKRETLYKCSEIMHLYRVLLICEM